MHPKVFTYQSPDDSKSCISIIDQDHSIYCPLVESFLLTEYSSHQCKFNTTKRRAYELVYFLHWLSHNKINIIARVKRGIFLTDFEIRKFGNDIRYKKSNLTNNDIFDYRTTDKNISNLLNAIKISKSEVSPNVTNGRVDTSFRYIKFLHFNLNYSIQAPETLENFTRNKQLFNNLKVIISNSEIDEKSNYSGKTISDFELDKLQEIIEPDSHNNPFTVGKYRNMLIVKTLIATGLRRGALAKLKISDCHFEKEMNRVDITKTLDDPSDPRINKPSQKTRAHITYIYPKLMRLLYKYVTKYRPLIPNSNTHEFIFVNEKNSRGTIGLPMSIDSFNYIFEVLSNSLNISIHPHILRHKWNEMFSVMCQEKGVSQEAENKYRKLLMGWEPNSIMSSTYNQTKENERVQGIMRIIQNKYIEGDVYESN